MHLKWNRRAKLIVGYGIILAITVTIGVTGLRASRDLAAQLAEAASVRAPALSDAALVERLAGVVQTRLDSIVSAASRHEAALAERFRAAVGSAPIDVSEHSIPVSMSFGVAGTWNMSEASGLFKKADEALYLAKQRGRNRVEIGAPILV